MDKLKRLQEQNDQAQEKADRAADRLPSMSALRGFDATVASRALTHVSRSIDSWYSRVSPSIGKLLQNTLDKVTDFFEFYPVLVAEAVHEFSRGDWMEATHVDLELTELQRLVADLKEEPDTVVRQILDEAIPSHFRQDDYASLRKMVQGWSSSSVFEGRGSLFDLALEAHVREEYTAAVYLLVPQVEGTLRKITGVDGPNGIKWRKKVNDRLGFNPQKGGRWLSDPARTVEEFKSFDKRRRFLEMRQLRIEAALMGLNALYEKDRGHEAFRDRVAHGKELDCSEADSIGLFCLLDQLFWVVWEYQRTGSRD